MLDAVVRAIPACPLAACLILLLFGRRVLQDRCHWPAILGCAGAFVGSVAALAATTAADFPAGGKTIPVYEWMAIPALGGDLPFQVSIAFRLDALSAVMLTMLTFVATLVAIYSAGYMHGDSGYWRFFAAVSLFVFSMINLVLAANFLQLFMFWEAVGLCSYLLIGFWYTKPSAAAAGFKAFLVNRIGDFGFAAGVFLIWTTFRTLDFAVVLDPARIQAVEAASPGVVETICLCLFAGACGKSAQFPLHVWLPDAMEGPTPVSALIHAATMVTAGVYMVARCTALYMTAPYAQLVVAIVGAFTALLAALTALTQTDLKRVLAYSTVSQLGFMFLGLGSGTYLGIAGGMFHLVTHAFFKALLFLGAGSVMHAMGGVIDMKQFGGLRRLMPVTCWTFLIGSAALAGFPGLSGFWSKDTILSAVRMAAADDHAPAAGHAVPHAAESEPAEAAEHPPAAASPSRREAVLLGITARTWYGWLFWSAAFTAFLTAFYTFRAALLTFFGPERIPPEAGHHAHESPPSMTLPLQILSVGAVVLGLALGHLTGLFDGYLNAAIPGTGAHHPADLFVMGLSTLAAILGIGLAWICYGQPTTLAAALANAVPPARRLSENKFYFDEIYFVALVLPLRCIAQLCRFIDWMIVDGLVGAVSALPRAVGQFLRPLQNGLVQFYALAMMLALALLAWGLLLGPSIRG